MKYLLCLFLIVTPLTSMAADSSGTISQLRATSTSTINAGGQRGIIIFKLDTTLNQNCTWLGLDKDNPYFASSLLSAHARKQRVRVWYDDANPMGSICWAWTIELIP